MNRLTLQGGPGNGNTVLVSDDTIRHGTYYYIERPSVQVLANTYRYKRKGDKTYRYRIKMKDGEYVGIYGNGR